MEPRGLYNRFVPLGQIDNSNPCMDTLVVWKYRICFDCCGNHLILDILENKKSSLTTTTTEEKTTEFVDDATYPLSFVSKERDNRDRQKSI